jgi:hypothetical protein
MVLSQILFRRSCRDSCPCLWGSALYVMLLPEMPIGILFIFNGLLSCHCRGALLGYHYQKLSDNLNEPGWSIRSAEGEPAGVSVCCGALSMRHRRMRLAKMGVSTDVDGARCCYLSL